MWHDQGVARLAEALRTRELDPWRLFTHFWQRIEQGPREVWTLLDREHAQAQARASQRRWEAGQQLGPLDGVPVAVKDVIDVAGQPTSAASLTRRHATAASQDAPVVQRLRAQGAILMGKTNLSELAFSGLGINPHFGTPLRSDAPEDAVAPGGSSSGSALALVHGMVPLALGSDTSGSARIPCAWNGLVGLRPSASRYPAGGMIALAPAMDVAGPMARNVQDLRWLDAAMAGEPMPEGHADGAWARPRLWVAEGRWLQDLDPIVERAFEAALATLQARGWTVWRQPHPVLEAAMELQAREGLLVSAQAARVHADLLADPQGLALLHAPVRQRLLHAQAMPADAEERLLLAREVLRARWQDSVGDHTLVVVPTTAGCAPALAPLLADDTAFAQANLRALRNTLPSSFLDAPSISLPVPRRHAPAGQGPGVGIQFSAASGQDARLLAWAAEIETALGAGVCLLAEDPFRPEHSKRASRCVDTHR